MKIPKELEGVVASDPEFLSGGLRFVGTRVFVKSLLDYVGAGAGIDDFLRSFPDVSREQAMAVADWLGGLAIETLDLDQAS